VCKDVSGNASYTVGVDGLLKMYRDGENRKLELGHGIGMGCWYSYVESALRAVNRDALYQPRLGEIYDAKESMILLSKSMDAEKIIVPMNEMSFTDLDCPR
jgi:hypothetical protein